jgi:hypothetical protein
LKGAQTVEAVPIRLKAKPRMELARRHIEQVKPEEVEKQPAPKIPIPDVIGPVDGEAGLV